MLFRSQEQAEKKAGEEVFGLRLPRNFTGLSTEATATLQRQVDKEDRVARSQSQRRIERKEKEKLRTKRQQSHKQRAINAEWKDLTGTSVPGRSGEFQINVTNKSKNPQGVTERRTVKGKIYGGIGVHQAKDGRTVLTDLTSGKRITYAPKGMRTTRIIGALERSGIQQLLRQEGEQAGSNPDFARRLKNFNRAKEAIESRDLDKMREIDWNA